MALRRRALSGYVGRFAPSPTGPLHFGSLVAAVASYLDARAHQGRWLIRVDDLDPPREVDGAAESILADLDALGMRADGPVVYQSRQQAHYDTALEKLLSAGIAFPCGCTRRDLPANGVYPGTCLDGIPAGRSPRSIRLRVDGADVGWQDRIQGAQHKNLGDSVGPFVIRRADGLTAYQLAVVVDDARAGITDIVRGADLADSTPRQIHLQRMLRLPTPRYAHVPVALDSRGRKLSKSTGARPVNTESPLSLLREVWQFLTGDADRTAPDDLQRWWRWAIKRWRLAQIPAVYGLAWASGDPESARRPRPLMSSNML